VLSGEGAFFVGELMAKPQKSWYTAKESADRLGMTPNQFKEWVATYSIIRRKGKDSSSVIHFDRESIDFVAALLQPNSKINTERTG
jgi:hypothetical protein